MAAEDGHGGFTTSALDFEARSIDTLRGRMNAIVANLQWLRGDLVNPYAVMPPWENILKACQDLGKNLSSLQALMHNPRAFERTVHSRDAGTDTHLPGFDVPGFLNRAHVYPTPAFPAECEHALDMLLSKRLAPVSEAWLDDAVMAAMVREREEDLGEGGDGEGAAGRVLSAKQLQELWNWAPIEGNDIARKVLTGEFDDDEDEEGEEGDEDEDDMEDVGGVAGDAAVVHMGLGDQGKAPARMAAVREPPGLPAMDIEDVLKFLSTGEVR